MGTTKAELISQRLIEQGRSPLTPIAVISCGTRHDQQILTGNLTQLAQLAKASSHPGIINRWRSCCITSPTCVVW